MTFITQGEVLLSFHLLTGLCTGCSTRVAEMQFIFFMIQYTSRRCACLSPWVTTVATTLIPARASRPLCFGKSFLENCDGFESVEQVQSRRTSRRRARSAHKSCSRITTSGIVCDERLPPSPGTSPMLLQWYSNGAYRVSPTDPFCPLLYSRPLKRGPSASGSGLSRNRRSHSLMALLAVVWALLQILLLRLRKIFENQNPSWGRR